MWWWCVKKSAQENENYEKHKAIMTEKKRLERILESPYIPHVYMNPLPRWDSTATAAAAVGLTVSAEEEKCSLKNHYMCVYVCFLYSMVAWFNSNLLYSGGSTSAVTTITTTTTIRKNISCFAYEISVWLRKRIMFHCCSASVSFCNKSVL